MHQVDTELNTKELHFLKDVAIILGLNNSDIDEVVNNPTSFPLTPPSAEQERMKILYLLLFAMRIDNEIHEREERIVYEVGLKLGFNEAMLTEMIDELKKHLDTRLPDDALLKIVQKYLN